MLNFIGNKLHKMLFIWCEESVNSSTLEYIVRQEKMLVFLGKIGISAVNQS